MFYLRDFPSGYYTNKNPLSPPLDRGEDAVTDGQNMIHTDRMTWIRRPGVTKWSTYEIPSDDPPASLFDYFDGHNQRFIVDGELTIREVTQFGSTLLHSKGVGAMTTSFADSRGVLYATTRLRAIVGANPVKHKRIRNGAFKVWGITKPALQPLVGFFGGIGDGVTIEIGWRYRFVYKDSSDGHVSSASPISNAVGPGTNDSIRVRGQGSGEARVNKIEIYRTKDGGSTLFYVDQLNNPGGGIEWTYHDDTQDVDLNTAIICPSETSNDPPPDGMENIIVHNERIIGIHEQTVRFSLHDVDLVDRPINGIREECWPALLTFQFPNPKALISTLSGVMVFTLVGDIFLISGTSIFDFQVRKIQEGFPVRAKKNVCKDGDTIYIYTGTSELVRFSDVMDVLSLPLSEADLAAFTPRTTHITVQRTGTRAMLYMAHNNGRVLAYNLNNGTWSTPWEFAGDVTVRVVYAGQPTEGDFKLLIGPANDKSGFIWFLDSSVHEDDGTPYECDLTFGNLVLAEPGDQAHVKAIMTESNGSTPTVAMSIGETSGDIPAGTWAVVDEPPLLTTPSSIISKRHYPQQSDTPLVGRHVRVKVSWPAVDDTSELFGLGIDARKLYETSGKN